MSDENDGSGDIRAGYSSQACAACKYQRRKCVPDCPLAPFFPSDSIKHFLKANKIFGVKNIIKLLRTLAPDQRPVAVKSLIYDANARDVDPIGGSYAIIRLLLRQIRRCKAEIDLVQQQLDVCRVLAAPSTLSHCQSANIDRLNSQDSSVPQFGYQDHDYKVFDERFTKKERGGFSSSCLTENSKKPIQYPPNDSNAVMGFDQKISALISSELDHQRDKAMIEELLAEGEDLESETKQEEGIHHLQLVSWLDADWP